MAVVIALAAGMEPLNPALATAPPVARPSQAPTLAPTYVAFLDDSVQYFYETLPKGTFRFAFRSRATVPGRFIAPPASAATSRMSMSISFPVLTMWFKPIPT